MEINELLIKLVEMKGSDLHISVGCYPCFRVNGILIHLGDAKLSPADTEILTKQIVTQEQLNELNEIGDYDISYAINNIGRFRINIFKQRGSYSIAARYVQINIPTLDELNMPNILYEFTHKTRGLVVELFSL